MLEAQSTTSPVCALIVVTVLALDRACELAGRCYASGASC